MTSGKVSIILLVINVVLKCATGSTPLPSKFYQYGPGVSKEWWLAERSGNVHDFDELNKIADYPNCPTYVENSYTFEHRLYVRSKRQYGRFRSYFIAQQTGKHKFFALVNNKCDVHIEMNPKGFQKILKITGRTGLSFDNWNERKWSSEVELVKGFRYLILVYYHGNGANPEYFRLGVKFPDNTELKPLDGTHLYRSMEFYKWNGLLAQKYDSMQFPGWDSFSLAGFYADNAAKYPSSPTSYTCKSSLYDPYQYQNFGDYYALRYIGYMKPPRNGTYSFKMWCNEMCEFFITKNNVETSLGQFRIRDYDYPKNQLMNGGSLVNPTWYPIKAFMTERYGSDYIRITYNADGGSDATNWAGMLRNLKSVETTFSLPKPIPTMVNSTAISAQLPSTPFLPPRDNWTYVATHEVLYFNVGDESRVFKIAVAGSLPKTVIATGLKKYTDYTFYALYYGYLNGTERHHIITRGITMKTDEDVPDTAPPNIVAAKQTSTEVKVSWRTYPDITLWNGIGIGWEVIYTAKDASPKNWTSAIINGAGNRQFRAQNLREYTFYEFKVAGRTSKGSGVFSSVVEERTKEDVPSSAPINIIAQNTSSSSISVTWDDILKEDQNGIITGYKVYLRKRGGSWTVSTVPTKSYVKSNLDLWAFYEIKVSGKTSIGEGVKSAVVEVRTDEDLPGAPPTSVTANAKQPKSINVTWSEINPSKTYGVIVSYKVKYRRNDGQDAPKEIIVYQKSALLENLDAYIDYDIQVAGMTIKGVGVFSSKLTHRTLPGAPSAPPTSLTGSFTSSTSIRVFWTSVPVPDRNGIITGYNVKYKKKIGAVEWKNVTVGAANVSLHVKSLDFYTVYQFKVAALNNIGSGPYSNITEIRTDADGPTRPPMNLTGHFIDHRNISMNWTRVPKEFRHGIVTGYKLYYKDGTISHAPWKYIVIPNRQNGSDVFSQNVTGLKIFTPYIFKVLAFTYKADGVFSENVTVWTDEFTPYEAPRNITGQNASSTEIVLHWNSMEEVDGDANGKVLGYIVRYRVTDCHEDRPAGCDEGQVFNITKYDPSGKIEIPQLRKYTSYSISVQVFNSKGKGVLSKTVNVTTAEDKPDAPPTIVETWPSKPNSINVFWSPIPESLRNGIILGYRIFYKPLNTSLHKYNRAPRAVDPSAVYGAEPGEKWKEVNATTYHTDIAELKDYSWYQIRIGAFTSVGLGTIFTINGTCKQRSPIEAPNLEITDMFDFYRISLKWNEISRSGARGEVLGYRIQYWLSELNDVPAVKVVAYHVDVLEPNRSVILNGLKPFGHYAIRILAFTEGGYGVWSYPKYGDTCRCPQRVSSARLPLPPLVYGAGRGLEILPAMLSEAVTSCCGNCSGRHGLSHVDWNRDSTNSSALKYDQNDLLTAMFAGTHLALPRFKDTMEVEGDDNAHVYGFVPLISARNLAIFSRRLTKRELGNAAAHLVQDSIWEQYPLLLISTVLTVLAGIFFWILECSKNSQDFSSSYTRGTGSGIWLAYITMTTVGYGDLVPITVRGRIFSVAWMLIGLVLTSMVIGNISSIFSVEFIFKPTHFITDGRVLTSEETLMLTAQLYGGKVTLANTNLLTTGNTSNGHFVQQSLLSGNISKVALEYYKASTLANYLDHPNIQLEKIVKIKGSYGVLIGGETKRIKHCVSRYAKEREQEILEKIDKLVYRYELGEPLKDELLDHIISPYADISVGLIKYGGIILLLLVFIGGLSELLKRIRARKKTGSYPSPLETFFNEVNEEIEKLSNDIDTSIKEIEDNHVTERLKFGRQQTGQQAALVSKYPDLHMFDPQMPKGWRKGKQESRPGSSQSYDTSSSRNYNFESDDESVVDMPIYYKR